MSIRIVAMIAGLDNYATATDVEPHDTIATLLSGLKKTLIRDKKPHEITGAYSIVHTRKTGLAEDDPDYFALENGDATVAAKYCTPAAQLDPTKTVRFYFGTRIAPETISILLTWPAEAVVRTRREHELGRIAFREWVAAHRTVGQTTPLQAITPVSETPTAPVASETSPVVEEIEETVATAETTPSPWHWLASCFPVAAVCSRWAKDAVMAGDDANKKKHD